MLWLWLSCAYSKSRTFQLCQRAGAQGVRAWPGVAGGIFHCTEHPASAETRGSWDLSVPAVGGMSWARGSERLCCAPLAGRNSCPVSQNPPRLQEVLWWLQLHPPALLQGQAMTLCQGRASSPGRRCSLAVQAACVPQHRAHPGSCDRGSSLGSMAAPREDVTCPACPLHGRAPRPAAGCAPVARGGRGGGEGSTEAGCAALCRAVPGLPRLVLLCSGPGRAIPAAPARPLSPTSANPRPLILLLEQASLRGLLATLFPIQRLF